MLPSLPSSTGWRQLSGLLWREIALAQLGAAFSRKPHPPPSVSNQSLSWMGFKMGSTVGTICTHPYLPGFPAFFLSPDPFSWESPPLPINHFICPDPIWSSAFGKPNLNTNRLNWFCKRQHLLTIFFSQFALCLFLSNKNRRHQIFNKTAYFP